MSDTHSCREESVVYMFAIYKEVGTNNFLSSRSLFSAVLVEDTKCRERAMNRRLTDGPDFIHGLANDIHDTAQGFTPDRNLNTAPAIRIR